MLSSLFGKKSADELIKLADDSFNKNDFSKALDNYLKALEQRPNDYLINNMVGVSYSRLGNWSEALNYFLFANKVKPNDALIINNIGQSYYSLQNYKEAIKYFAKATELNPKNAKYFNSLGNAYFSIRNYKQAAECYSIACELEPENLDYQDNLEDVNDLLYGAEDFNNSDDEISKLDANELLDKGDEFFDKESYELAIKYYKESIKKNPENPTAYNNIGAAYSFLENNKSALEYYKKAIKLDPLNPTYNNNMGLVYRNLGDYEQAVNFFRKAARLAPNEKKYRDNLIDAENKLKFDEEFFEDNEDEVNKTYDDNGSYINQKAKEYYEYATDIFTNGDYQKAINVLKKAIKIEPDYPDALNLIGNSYTFLDDWATAVEYYQKCIKLKPNDEIYNKNLGNALISIEQYDKAIKHLKKAIQINEDFTDAYIKLGDTYTHIEEWEEALKSYQTADKKQPDQNYTISSIGYCYSNLGNDQNAIKYYKKAIELDPSDKVTYNLLGNVYCKIEKWNDAIECFRKAISIEPDSALYHKNLGYAFQNVNKIDEAIKEYKLAQKYDPDDTSLEELIEEARSGIIKKNEPETKKDSADFCSNGINNIDLDDILQELNQLIGLDNIKEEIQNLIKFIKVEKQRQELGLSATKLTLHRVFVGPPGTGKTTIARLMGKIFKALGILEKGHVIEVDRQNLVGNAWGTTGPKTSKVIDEALDGILFIDEAYTLKQSEDDSFGQDAIDTLLKRMEDNRHRLVVIVAGYPDEMKKLINSNPGLRSRFTKFFEFKDYTPEQLMKIFKKVSGKFQLTPEAEKKLQRYFDFAYKSKDKSFGNARFVVNLFQEISQIQASRVHNIDTRNLSEAELKKVFSEITLEDIENTVKDVFVDIEVESLDSVMNELKDLVGLDNVKQDVESLVKHIKVEKLRREKGLSNNPITLHSVFAGPPGTGKTTVARLMGKIFYLLGLSPRGHVVEVDRADLVGTHWGQTGPKTQKVLDDAMGGILFIDEAYTLKQKEDDVFGQDAIDTILRIMDNERDKLIVIIAGYTDEMKTLIATNPGLESRFTRYFYFNDYTPEELLRIFISMCTSKKLKRPYIITQEAQEVLYDIFNNAYQNKDRSFGNGRFVRNLFEKVIQAMAYRIPETGEITEDDLLTIYKGDVLQVLKMNPDIYKVPKAKPKKIGF